MTSSQWERFAPAGGIVFVAFTVVGILLPRVVAGPLDYRASAEEVARYALDYDDLLHMAAGLRGVGLFLFLWFLGGLFSALRRAEGGTGWLSALAFGSGVATAALLLVQLGVELASVHGLHLSRAGEPGPLDPQGGVTLLFLARSLLFASVFPAAALLAATTILGLQTQILPRWLGRASAVLAFLSVFAGGFGGYFAWAAFPFLFLWVAATSVVLMRRPVPEQVGR